MAAADPQAGQRVLMVAVGDYLERSQMVLIELSNANPKGSLDISAEQERAGDLVTETRLYRQTAARTGDTQITGVLDELERVLVDITHAPSNMTPSQLQELRQRLEARRHSLQDPRTGLQRPEPGSSGRAGAPPDTLKGKRNMDYSRTLTPVCSLLATALLAFAQTSPPAAAPPAPPAPPVAWEQTPAPAAAPRPAAARAGACGPNPSSTACPASSRGTA